MSDGVFRASELQICKVCGALAGGAYCAARHGELDCVPSALRICGECGALAWGPTCACERLALEYDARYHAARAAELFDRMPRDLAIEDGMAWDGLGALRGAALLLKITAIAGAIAFLLGLALSWWMR